MVRVKAEPLSAVGWAPFGWLPVEDTDPSDRLNRLAFEWQDVHVNVIAHLASEVVQHDRLVHCAEMYRHDTHTQALLVLDSPAVIAVAPASTRFEDAQDVASIRAFILQPLDSVVLHRGTWHWGPFPVGGDSVRLFNVQGQRYLEDNSCVSLDDRRFDVEVELPTVMR
jgi:ureidoglycolate hydrolase